MPSLMAIISRAIFDAEARGLTVGDVWATACYASQNKALALLRDGGDLYLVTVRPPDETLWLVGVLRAPRLEPRGWCAAANTTPITVLTPVRGELRFATGAGLPTKRGALGMSLQTPRVLTDDDVAALARVTGARRRRGAPPVAPTTRPANPPRARERAAEPAAAAPPPAAAAATSGDGARPELDRALDHLRAGRARDALDDALAAWRALRAPALAELVALVSRQVDRGVAPITSREAWIDVAGRRDPGDIGQLVATLGDTTVVGLKPRYELLRAFAPDPRIVGPALAIPPRFSYEAGPAMTRAFEIAERAGDPGSRTHLEAALRALAPRPGASKAWRAYLEKHRRRARKLLDELPTEVPVPRGVVAQVAMCTAACERLLAGAPPPPSTATPRPRRAAGRLDDLLAAVLAAPDDDDVRAVYADALQDRGDPRGELIALQLAGKPATAARERALLKAHLDDWLHPIGAVIRRDSIRFARGFLDACRVELKISGQRALFEHPLWSTIRELDCDDMALVTRPNLRSLRRATLTPSALSTLAARDAPVPLEAVIGPERMVYGLRLRLGTELGEPGAWRPALAIGALVHLRALQVYARDASVAKLRFLLDAPLGRQLVELDVFSANRSQRIAPWIAVVRDTSLRVRLRFTNDNTSSGDPEHLAVFDLARASDSVAVTLSLNQDMRDIRYLGIGGQIEQAIAGVPRRVAPSITVRYVGSKRRTIQGFPGIADRLRAAFDHVVME